MMKIRGLSLEWARKNGLFWLNLLFLFFSLFLLFNNFYQDLFLRCWGTVLQLVGVVIAGSDLYKAAKEHDHPGILHNTRAWLREGFGRRKGIICEASVQLMGAVVSSAAGTVAQLKGSSLEERLDALEKELLNTKDELFKAHAKFHESIESLKQKVVEEVGRMDSGHSKLHSKLKQAVIGDYANIMFGAVWLTVGMIFSTFPDEILDIRQCLDSL